MKVGLSSASLSQMELTDLVTWTIRPRLLAIPGVANVAVWGQRTPELQVVVDPDAVHARGLTVAAIERAARAAVALDAGGFVDTPNQRLAVHLAPVVTNAEDLGRAVVAFAGGAPVRLRDVAEIRLGHAPPIGDAVIDDGAHLVERQAISHAADRLVGVAHREDAIEQFARIRPPDLQLSKRRDVEDARVLADAAHWPRLALHPPQDSQKVFLCGAGRDRRAARPQAVQ